MTAHKVTFLPDGVTVQVEDGANLLQTAMRAGIHVNASCGGEGVCGKCRIILESGHLESPRSEHISPADYEQGYRQACKAWVRGQVQVRIPVESQLSAKALNRMRPSVNASREAQEISIEQLKAQELFNPPYVKYLVKVNPPAPGDNISDLNRVINHLKSQYDVHNLQVDFKAIKSLSRVVREGDFETTVTLAYPPSHVVDPDSSKIGLTDVQPGDHTRKNYALAVDIGTTTVYVQLLDMVTGEIVDRAGDFNRQLSYGEDVISRIIYAGREGGLQKMQQLIVQTINNLIDRVCRRQRVDPEDITMLTAAGNTTMTQLFVGVDPKYIRLAPYVPTANYYPPLRAVYLGLNLAEHVMVNVFPAVSSYVGGDIVSGVLASGMYKEPDLTLFIDLGTNGEIVVGNQDWMACASCSAGPAFEGGGVKFGMRATAGAIEDFAINPDTMEPMILTVDMKKPKGICGSGLINTVAGLFEMSIIDERGKFDRTLSSKRVREGEDGWEYVLSFAPDNQLGRDIVLTEVDIDNLIRAKAAMYAGFQTLLEGVGLDMHSLDRVIIAGGFGRYINLEKSILIGLLPELDLDKFTFIGNGSLIGCRLTCLSNELRFEAGTIESKMTNFELSEVPSYMDYYVSSQFLPHTNREFFPRVLERVTQTRQLVRG
ncbi:MAG: ASKHA domain-containing protein [Thermodesulfobacteriota bacterium]